LPGGLGTLERHTKQDGGSLAIRGGASRRERAVELEELLALQTQAIADLAELSERDVRDSVKVAAITRRVEIAERRLVFRAQLRTLRAEAEARDVLDRLLRVLTQRRQDVPGVLVEDLLAIVAEYRPQPGEAAA
jgi:hypothetical protein